MYVEVLNAVKKMVSYPFCNRQAVGIGVGVGDV
jgi:hypothetical protein